MKCPPIHIFFGDVKYVMKCPPLHVSVFFWRLNFFYGDHFTIKGHQKATFWKSELGALTEYIHFSIMYWFKFQLFQNHKSLHFCPLGYPNFILDKFGIWDTKPRYVYASQQHQICLSCWLFYSILAIWDHILDQILDYNYVACS